MLNQGFVEVDGDLARPGPRLGRYHRYFHPESRHSEYGDLGWATTGEASS